MKARLLWMSVFLATCALPLAAHGTATDAIGRDIDAVFARYTPDGPGCAMGVFQNGRIVFAKAYGLANIEYDVPLSPRTPMIMGSVTKQFTAAAIALLVEQGRLSLDDDVHKYVPELADYGQPITVRQLVHHTSGIRDWWALVDAAGMRADDGYTVQDVLAMAARQKHLNFTPGAEYNYSNTGYVLLGVIVQRVSGQTLRQFAAERIFAPLGMTASHYHDDHNEPVKGRAFAYRPIAGKPGAWTIDVWNNDIVGQGGLMTTVEELQRWDENFYTGSVGGKGFLTRQLERGRLNDGTALTRFPAQHTSVVTMCNASTADASGLALRVADVVLAAHFTASAPAGTPAPRAPAPAGSVALSEAQLSSMTGRFYSEELNTTYTLARAGSSLVLTRLRAEPDTLRAIDAQTLQSLRSRGITLRFSSPSTFTLDNGRARGLEFRRVDE